MTNEGLALVYEMTGDTKNVGYYISIPKCV